MTAERKDRSEQGVPGWNASAGPGSHGAGGGVERGDAEDLTPGSHFEGEFGEDPWSGAGLRRDSASGQDGDEPFSEYRPEGGYGFGSRLRRVDESSGER